MTCYDLAIWRWREDCWPQVVTTQAAETAANAVLCVMQRFGIWRCEKVVANPGDGLVWRWYSVVGTASGFVYREEHCRRLGVPVTEVRMAQSK
jgi:hypothetical protein